MAVSFKGLGLRTEHRMKQGLLLALAGVLVVLIPEPSRLFAQEEGPQPIATDATQTQVDIGMMYAGGYVYFFGWMPDPSADVVVRLTSVEEEPIVVNIKGKVGPLWMNVKQYRVEGLPRMYKIHSTRPLSEFLPESLARELGIGYWTLKERMKLEIMRGEPSEGDRDLVFEGLLKIKTEANLYNIDENRIRVTGGKLFKHSFRFPPAAKEGTYVAESFVIKDGRLIGRGQDRIVIQKTGLEAALTELAHGWPTLYGVMAVVVAVGMGLLVGFIFKKGGGH